MYSHAASRIAMLPLRNSLHLKHLRRERELVAAFPASRHLCRIRLYAAVAARGAPVANTEFRWCSWLHVAR